HLRLGKDSRPALFRQVEIVEIQSILSAVAAAHHAATTADACSTRRPLPSEERIRNSRVPLLTFGRLKNSNPRAIKRFGHTGDFPSALQKLISSPQNVVLPYAQHSRRGLIVLRHLDLPIRQACPRSAVPDLVRRRQQSGGISNRS